MAGFIDVTDEASARARMRELEAEDREREAAKAAKEEAARKSNRDFTQVYPKGWARLQLLIQTNPSAARVYAFLAENIDGDSGVLLASQETIAEALGIHERTVRRLTKILEDQAALVRIRVGIGVYAYALDPHEVWKSWDDKKPYAAFVTRTLVRKSDKANGTVRRKLKIMIGEPELPL